MEAMVLVQLDMFESVKYIYSPYHLASDSELQNDLNFYSVE